MFSTLFNTIRVFLVLLVGSFIIVYVRILVALEQELPLVKIPDGELTGTYYTTEAGRTIYAFYGIPYASPPIGEYRFKEPQPVKPWTGIKNATKEYMCAQYDSFINKIVGEEDCLYLNIFTTKLPGDGDENPSLDVIVNIHGGGFSVGSGNGYNPDYFLKFADVVLVNINYRLGPIGFFSTGDDVVPGNNGFKDQVAALRWVKRNIANFGGNADSITLYGLSAGATSVHLHYVSPLSKGLFHRGISSSGTVFTSVFNTTESSMMLAAALECPINSSIATVNCLQQKAVKDIITKLDVFQKWKSYPLLLFLPVIERPSTNAFLIENPIRSLAKGKFQNIPWLFGMVENEGLFPAAEFINNDEALREIDEKWQSISQYLLNFDYVKNETRIDNISRIVRETYIPNKNITKEVTKEFVQIFSDRYFYNPIRSSAAKHAKATTSEVYCYRFSYRGSFSLSDILSNSTNNYGVCHSDDIQYIFKIKQPMFDLDKHSEDDKKIRDVMASIVVSFAHTGKPTVKNVNWETFSKYKGAIFDCLQISSPTDLKMSIFDSYPVSSIWETLLPDENV